MKQNQYQILKEQQQKEFDNLPIFYAFGKKQFKEAMKKLNLQETDVNQIVALPGGGNIKKTDIPKLLALITKHKKELEEKISEDKTGDGFIKDMFLYELVKHEYGYTREIDETLDALDISIYRLKHNKRLLTGLELAKKAINGNEKEEEKEEEKDK